MKKQDLIMLIIIVLLFLPFFIFDSIYSVYEKFNSSHAYITSFIKFAVLATYGEVIGLRIRTGKYNLKGFGLLPRAIVWGFLGITIKAAFVIFSAGAPLILSYLGMHEPSAIMSSPLSGDKVLIAFSISVAMNLIFSPVLMTAHKITDTQIITYNGSMSCFLQPLKIGKILKETDWNMHWGFVLKKTIPFFWIPAHTITFLLPVDFQILFAAMLGIALGIILAFASSAKTFNSNEE
ncbi:MAG: hypothetical protein C0408_09615 [Odoribacter sp.]|nr:hypothetical protein [Odoribacter sp.]